MIRMYAGLALMGNGVAALSGSYSTQMYWLGLVGGLCIGVGAVLLCGGLGWLIRDIAQKPWKGRP